MAYYNTWYVSDEYLTTALGQLDDDGLDMAQIFVLPCTENQSDYQIVYNKDNKK